jgi:hypothetical protein
MIALPPGRRKLVFNAFGWVLMVRLSHKFLTSSYAGHLIFSHHKDTLTPAKHHDQQLPCVGHWRSLGCERNAPLVSLFLDMVSQVELNNPQTTQYWYLLWPLPDNILGIVPIACVPETTHNLLRTAQVDGSLCRYCSICWYNSCCLEIARMFDRWFLL